MNQFQKQGEFENLKVGVDATCWQNNRGYGRHARALLRNLVLLDVDSSYTFILDSMEHIENIPERVELRLVETSTPTTLAAASENHRSYIDMLRMSRAFSRSEFDVLLFPTVYSFVPVFSRAKKLVMIHDVIPEKFPDLTFPARIPRLLWRAKTALGRWQADAIVTVSEYSRRGIIEQFNVPSDQVYVVGEASDPVFRVLDAPCTTPDVTPRLAALGIPSESRLIVYVGGFGPHKNLETLVTVFDRLATQSDFGDVHLVMVGEYKKEVFHSTVGMLQEQLFKLGIDGRTIFTDYLPDEELVVLLNLATLLVLPSWMEGFGLPAVEAAACGCPVVATNASPLPDLLGAGGLYVDPARPAELEHALQRVLSSPDLRGQMREAGLTAACALTWEAAARQMKDLIHQVVKR